MNRKTELLPAVKQKVWGWPAVANFSLSGIAASFCLLINLPVIIQGGTGNVSHLPALKLIAPIMASIGFLALTTEAGRPLRAHRLFRNQKHSWMSRETLFGMIFILVSILDWLFFHKALTILSSVSGMGLLVSHSFMIYGARAVTAWNKNLALVLFATSSFVMGSGVLLIASPIGSASMLYPVLIGLFCVILDLIVWLLNKGWLYSAEVHSAKRSLFRLHSLIFTAGIGHMLPLVLLVLLLNVSGNEIGNGAWDIYAFLTGMAMVVGGVNLKFEIIVSSGYLRPISIARRQK